MSSCERAKNGSWRYQVIRFDGERRDVFFPKEVQKKDAETLRSNFDRVIQAAKLKEPLDVKTQEWLSKLDENLYEKLVKLKAVEPRANPTTTIGGFISFYLKEYGHSPETKRKLTDVAGKIVKYFGKDTLMSKVTKGEATRFYNKLSEKKVWTSDGELDLDQGGFGLAKDSTAARHLGVCRQFWSAAIEEEFILRNPFANKKLSTRVRTNKKRQHYIDVETSNIILDAMPNLVWRLRFALMRWQGLRCPSELNVLRWDAIDWAGQKILIRAPKTNHIEGKESRLAGIMPEVLPLLEQMFERADNGAELVLPRMAHKNYTKFFKKYLERAGIEIWPALFNNLRKSAVTDAQEYLPSHVADDWFGHSETVSKEHYRMVTENHFEMVRRRVPATTQITTQQASETPDLIGTEQNTPKADVANFSKKRPDPEQTRQLPERTRWAEKVKLGDEGLEPPTSTV